MNLAEQITDLSLQLYLPLQTKKGRAHRYERVFRTGIEGIKSNALLSLDEMVQRVAGHILKRLRYMKGGVPLAYGEEQTRIARALAELLVQQLFEVRCKCSVSKLTHEENWLADTVYFLTDEQINARWTAYRQRNPQAAKIESEIAAEIEAGEEEEEDTGR